MGHEPFEHHLSYAPIRLFSGAGVNNQIYDEMHTSDWWWRTQEEIPDSSTIIPILLASDKTMLLLYHGQYISLLGIWTEKLVANKQSLDQFF